jgi:hypothetical protein
MLVMFNLGTQSLARTLFFLCADLIGVKTSGGKITELPVG